MPRFVDLSGRKFGRLTVVERAENSGKRTMWRCVCDCGKVKNIGSSDILSGCTISCGCYHKERVSESHLKNIVGKRYGNLVVVKREESPSSGSSKWLCKCDCGNEVVVTGNSLKRGDSFRCGWKCKIPYSNKNIIDITGNTYGNLFVIGRDNSVRRRVRWICRCMCGKVYSVSGNSIRQGKTKSCGCISRTSAFIQFYNRLKNSAKDRGISWNLTDVFVKDITSKNCFYCGKKPSKYVLAGGGEKYTYNGIDRIDSSIGYKQKNCVPCCWNCNRKKSATNQSEFKDWIISVYNHWASK